MEAVCSSEKSVNLYHIIRRHIPEDSSTLQYLQTFTLFSIPT
jgi:hypothetical protein